MSSVHVQLPVQSPPPHPPPGVSFTIKPVFVLTCRWPAPLHPVASKGMVNQAFSCAEACRALHSAPRPPPFLHLPEGSQLSGASRNSGCTPPPCSNAPRCCVIPMPWSFNRTKTTHCNRPKLMSQSYCTARRLDSAAGL